MPGIVTVRSPEGKTFGVPEEHLGAYTSQGFTLENDEDFANRIGSEVKSEIYGGASGAIKAAGLGALSGLTVGGSDALISALGGRETLEGYKSENPLASLGGNIVGSAIPAFFTGGTSAEASLGAKILGATPAGLTSKLGHAVSGAVAGAEAGVLRKAGAAAVGAAAEGALYGGGGYISESALQNKPLSAEGFVAGMGKGALFAAPIGAGFRLGGEALLRARSLFPRSELSAEAAKVAQQEATTALKDSVADGQQMLTTARQVIAENEAKAAVASSDAHITRTVFRGTDPAAVEQAAASAADNTALASATAKLEESQSALEKWIADGGESELEGVLGSSDLQTAAAGLEDVGYPLKKGRFHFDQGRGQGEWTADWARPDGPEVPGLSQAYNDIHGGAPGLYPSESTLDTALSGLRAPDIQGRGRVPVGEFTEPGKGGIKTPEELAQAVVDAQAEHDLSALAPREVTPSSLEKTGVGGGARDTLDFAAGKTPLASEAPTAPAESSGPTPVSIAEVIKDEPLDIDGMSIGNLRALRKKIVDESDAMPVGEAGFDPAIFDSAMDRLDAVDARIKHLESNPRPSLADSGGRIIPNETEFRKIQSEFRKQLSPDELEKALQYADYLYSDVNRSLRKSGPVAEPEKIRPIVDAMDSVIAKSTIDAPLVTHRSVHFDPGDPRYDYQPGDTIYDPGFQSTDFRHDSAHKFGNIQFIITNPPGTRIAPIPSKFTEGEYTLARGSTLRVTGRVDHPDGKVTLRATVVAQDGNPNIGIADAGATSAHTLAPAGGSASAAAAPSPPTLSDAEYAAYKRQYGNTKESGDSIDSEFWYSKGGDGSINGDLRSGATPDAHTQQAINHLDAAMELPEARLPRAAMLYRSMQGRWAKDYFATLKPGDVYEDLAYTSTSTGELSKSRNGHVVVNIIAPEGAKALPIRGKFSNETELLLPRGSRFRVVSNEIKPYEPTPYRWMNDPDYISHEVNPDLSVDIKRYQADAGGGRSEIGTYKAPPYRELTVELLGDHAPAKPGSLAGDIPLDAPVDRLSYRQINKLRDDIDDQISRLKDDGATEDNSPELARLYEIDDALRVRRIGIKEGSIPDVPRSEEWTPATDHGILKIETSAPSAAPANPPGDADVSALAPRSALHPPATLEEFGALVQDAANRAPTSHGFGDNEVFVSRIYDAIKDRLGGMDLPTFKRYLVQAQMYDHLKMSRADLVDAMDPGAVASSEIDDMGAQFHFVQRSKAPTDAEAAAAVRDIQASVLPRIKGRYVVRKPIASEDVALSSQDIAAPGPSDKPPAGFSLEKLNEGGVRSDPEKVSVRYGVPARGKLGANGEWRDKAFVIRPSDLLGKDVRGIESGADMLGDSRTAGIRDAWSKGETVPAIEVHVTPKGKLFIADGNHRVFAAAQEGDRPMLAQFRPISSEVGSMDRIDPLLKRALKQVPEAAHAAAPEAEVAARSIVDELGAKSSLPAPSPIEPIPSSPIIVKRGSGRDMMTATMPDGTTRDIDIAKGEGDEFLSSHLPSGFKSGGLISPRSPFSIRYDIPMDADAVVDKALHVVRPSELAKRKLMGNALETESRSAKEYIDDMERVWAEGKKFDPIVAYVRPDGTVYIEDGNHRLQAAARTDRDVAVSFRDGTSYEPQANSRPISERIRAELPTPEQAVIHQPTPIADSLGEPAPSTSVGRQPRTVFAAEAEAATPKNASVEADTELERLLRGTSDRLSAGESIRSISAGPEAKYVAEKAAKTEEAAKHFRDKAVKKNYDGSEMAAVEKAAQSGPEQAAMDIVGAIENPPDNSRSKRAAASIVDAAGIAAPEAGGGRRGTVNNINDLERILGPVPDEGWSSVERTKVSSLMPEDMRRVADDLAIERLLKKHNGKDVDIAPAIERAAKVIGDHESASADVAELLGERAPKTAVARASKVREARAKQADQQAQSAARSAGDLDRTAIDPSLQAELTAGLREPTVVDPSIRSQMKGLRGEIGRNGTSVEPDFDLKMLAAEAQRQDEIAAQAAAAKKAKADARAAAKAERAAARAAKSEARQAQQAERNQAADILSAMGVHVPFLGRIPFIGPVLNSFLRARAVLGIIGRKGGSIPRTAEGLIASKAAATQDRLAAATQAMLTKTGRAAKRLSEVTAGPAVNLGYSLFPGEDKERTRSKDIQALYRKRMDELARASRPGAVDAAIGDRYQMADAELQNAISAQVQRGISFLAKKAPKAVSLPGSLPGDTKWQPSKAQLEVFGRYAHAVSDPISVIEDLAKGHLSLEGAEVLREVYPELFREAQRMLLKAMPTLQASMPATRRVAISTLYKIPLDSSMTPQHLRYLTAPPPGADPAAAMGGAPPPGGGAPGLTGQLQIGQQTMTSLDRRAGS